MGTSAFKSSSAKVLDSVLCIALRRPVAGLSAGIVWSKILNPFEPASSPKGGGRFLAPSGLDATGWGIGGAMDSSGRTSALKFLLVLKGVEEGV